MHKYLCIIYFNQSRCLDLKVVSDRKILFDIPVVDDLSFATSQHIRHVFKINFVAAIKYFQ